MKFAGRISRNRLVKEPAIVIDDVRLGKGARMRRRVVLVVLDVVVFAAAASCYATLVDCVDYNERLDEDARRQ